MGRNTLAKSLALLFLIITTLISIVIFINLYGINSSEAQKFPTWEDLQKEGDSSDLFFPNDPELATLRKEIRYIIDLYADGNDPLVEESKSKKFGVASKDTKANDGIGSIREASNLRAEIFWSNPPEVEPEDVSGRKNSSSVPGILNVHIWEGWCGPRVEDMKRDKHFPLYPSFKTSLNLFFSQWNEAGYGERIFGYLHPPETGNYTFAVSCDDNCEIWLSRTSSPAHIEKIASVGTLEAPTNTMVGNFKSYASQISKQIYLEAGQQYYVEALHKQAAYKDHLLLTWLAPSWSRIKTISSQFISSYISDELDSICVDDYTQYIPQTKAVQSGKLYSDTKNIYYFNRTKYKFGSSHLYSRWNYSFNIVNSSDFIDILDPIEYKPTYTINFTPRRYEGVKLIHETSVYPNDNTELTHMFTYEDCIVHRQSSLYEMFPGFADEQEHLITNLSFKDRYKYLANFYNDRIKYFKSNHLYRPANKNIFESHNYAEKPGKKKDNFVSKLSRKRKKNFVKSDSNIFNNFDINSYQKEQDDAYFSPEDGETNAKIQSKVAEKLAKMSNLNTEEDNQVVENILHLDSYKRRKLLSFQNIVHAESREFQKQKYTFQVKSNEYGDDYTPTVNIVNADVPLVDTAKDVTNKSYKPKMFFDDEDLPGNLLENAVRSRPIKIPDETNNHVLPSVGLPTMDSAGFSNTKHRNKLLKKKKIAKKKKKKRKYTQGALYDPTPSPILEKVFIKDGRFTNGSAIDIMNREQMRWLFNVFGSSVYYLSSSSDRHFRWLHNYLLSECKTDGNLQLTEEVALTIVDVYMKAVKAKHGRKYTLKRIMNVEENHDIMRGERYLIELELNVQGQDWPLYLSRYVYRPLGLLKLFEINDFQWNPHATVHIIVPVKNQGRWVTHFIKNMEKIYTTIKDPYLNVIIVDFNSTDINIERNLQESKLVRYQLISLDGPFQRALGVQAGADSIKNPDDIIFACDLHLEIPIHLIQIIREHTIKKKMAFAPMVLRLSCGYTPELPYGLWEIQGYGLFSISKYDFDRIGGMNTKEFKTKWGGEDWEFLDRTLAHGLEVERMRIPDFYHYYHSKKRMWVAPKSTSNPITNAY